MADHSIIIMNEDGGILAHEMEQRIQTKSERVLDDAVSQCVSMSVRTSTESPFLLSVPCWTSSILLFNPSVEACGLARLGCRRREFLLTVGAYGPDEPVAPEVPMIDLPVQWRTKPGKRGRQAHMMPVFISTNAHIADIMKLTENLPRG